MTPLTDAQLAAIAEATRKNQYASGISIDQAFRVEALLSHIGFQTARLAEAEQTIEQRVATIHGLSRIIDGHEAEMEDLGQRCDKAVADLAAAQATIERLKVSRMKWFKKSCRMAIALSLYADTDNWDTVTLTEGGRGDVTYWDRDGYGWDVAKRAIDARELLAPPAPEADDGTE